MKKVQLKLDTLQVESFQTAERVREQGTVDAHQIVTRFNNCTNTTCPPYNCFCTENLSCDCQYQ
ncbi:MAG TPA: hypothetical protein VEQ60_28430 [Longimicrobium sp.]|nr:hypothetical protein [Longimicrobium sp.]